MAYYYPEPSHTFSEYLLVPGYTSEECIPDRVSLKTPLVKYRKGQEEPAISLNIPMTSAVMQSVSNDTLAIALAKEGGISFIFGSQTIEDQAAMVARVKGHKAGFVTSASNLTPDATLKDVLALKAKNGFSTIAITEDGTANGKLLGIVASRDYRVSRMTGDEKVSEFMTPRAKLVVAPEGTSLKEANDIIWDNKLNTLPIVDENDNLVCFVFRKDYASHKEHPLELLDDKKRYLVGAGINTRDYAKRIPALIEAGVDVLVIDSSEGYTCWQANTIKWVRENYGDTVKIGEATWWTRTASVSWLRPALTSSRSVSAAVPSASPVRPRASAVVRLPQSSMWLQPVTSTLRRPASMCPSAPTVVSFMTTT